jgi:hypothetical protein
MTTKVVAGVHASCGRLQVEEKSTLIGMSNALVVDQALLFNRAGAAEAFCSVVEQASLREMRSQLATLGFNLADNYWTISPFRL